MPGFVHKDIALVEISEYKSKGSVSEISMEKRRKNRPHSC